MSVYDRPAIPQSEIGPIAPPRLKRLRLVAILLSLLLLALVSFVFGVFVSIVADLPSLTRFSLYRNEQSSFLYDDFDHPIGVLSQQNRVILTPAQIPPLVKEAVVSIEDKRFYHNSGVDLRGIGRALIADVRNQGGVQGASTIEQQFIKNALQAQSHRTIFEKLREAALAYQLSHKWSKDKIITAYLNTIYFGNGAYGIEAAAQTYFGHEPEHEGCGMPGHELCVQQLQPWEAAMLAGVIQSPSAYNPAVDQAHALTRRNVVLRQMLEQGYLTRPIYQHSVAQPLPSAAEIQAPEEQPVEGVDVGYFTSWVQQQVIERYGAQRAFAGGLKIKTTLDLELQRAAEAAVNSYFGEEGPTASLVAIENSTGEVRAMVGGRNYARYPFNLATDGERQPGSAFKAFDLAAALEAGISPYSVWTSKQKVFVVHSPRGPERFVVHNDEGAYSGSNTLVGATAFSDNSIYAEVGLRVGTHRIALLAHRMGITTPLSTNPAMTIGGLTVGVTPLDMAHAYETIAHGGDRMSGSMTQNGQPVGIQEVTAGSRLLPDGNHHDRNRVTAARILPSWVAQTETGMLETVLQYGTGRAASIGQFAAGKTGTTSNYGDAWFVGWDSKYTVAVWVGYPEKLVPMTNDFDGGPVLGGTYPALIWHNFMNSALQIDTSREAAGKNGSSSSSSTRTTGGSEGSSPSPSSRSGSGSGSGKSSKASHGGSGSSPPAPSKPAESAQPTPERTPSPAPSHETPSAPTPAPTPAQQAPSSGSSAGGTEAGGASAP
ncbi:MAG TPA: transglycosylase domain-containing protein [Solirubrobacteraceae bacterium]|nr:transglycosylase domain-containing protein [Solirubrobacteraceae bacterium]